MTNAPWRQHLEFATETAWQAGQLTLGYFQTGLHPDLKDDDSPVTVADRKSEQLIRHRIESHYPNYGILGEEYGEAAAQGSERRWIVDPIDGTRSFVRGVPLYAVLIALEVGDDVPVGVAYFPALGEMLAAADGLGCWWNGRPARVSDQPRGRPHTPTPPASLNLDAKPSGSASRPAALPVAAGPTPTDTCSLPPVAPKSCSIPS